MKFLLCLTSLLIAAPSMAHGAIVKKDPHANELDDCVHHAAQWLHKPATKDKAISSASSHCTSSMGVHKSSCAQYRDLLHMAFKRQPSDKLYNAETFCDIAEGYVKQLSKAHNVPNMGKGAGFDFQLAKSCKTEALKSMAPNTELPAESAPNFWYALCMNQDCAHFLPSRTRWCTSNHQPTHAASVCEALHSFIKGKLDLKVLHSHVNAGEMCGMFESFVEETHLDYEAYMHVVHDRVPGLAVGKPSKSMAGLATVPSIAIALLAFHA